MIRDLSSAMIFIWGNTFAALLALIALGIRAIGVSIHYTGHFLGELAESILNWIETNS